MEGDAKKTETDDYEDDDDGDVLLRKSRLEHLDLG